MNSKIFYAVVLTLGMLCARHTGAQPLSWRDEAPLPKQGVGFGFAALNGELYAAGGNCGSHCQLATLDKYNPVANTWAARAPMLTNRLYPAAAALNGRLYISGGVHEEDGWTITQGSTEAYDPLNDTWMPRASLRDSRSAHCAVVLNGRIYALGGEYSSPQLSGSLPLASVEEYDPIADLWVRKASMPVPRAAFGAVVLNGKIYVMGGWNNAEPHGIASVYSYTPASDSWATNASLPTPRKWLGAVVIGGRILALGGSAYDGTYYRDCAIVEEYDPSSDTWVRKPDLPLARGECFAACLGAPSKALFVCGGHINFSLQAASLLPALEIRGDLELRFQGESGMTYQLQASPDLVAWTNFDAAITCPGGLWSKTYSPPVGGKLFFRLTQP